MEITELSRVDINEYSGRAVIILSLPDDIHVRYFVQFYTQVSEIYLNKGVVSYNKNDAYKSYWLKCIDVFNVSYDDFTLKNMSGELNCSIVDLDIYYNLYLYLINKITEQELRNNISKLFNKDA